MRNKPVVGKQISKWRNTYFITYLSTQRELNILCVKYSLYSPGGNDDVIIQDGASNGSHIPYTVATDIANNNFKCVAQQFALYPAGRPIALPSRRCFWFLVFFTFRVRYDVIWRGHTLFRHFVTVCGSIVMLFSSFSSEVIPLPKALDTSYFCR